MRDILAFTAPIYLVAAIGYLCTRAGLFARADMRVLGKYVVNLALPCLLFNALAQRSLAQVLHPMFVAAYAIGSVFTLVVGIAWARRLARKPVSEAAIVGMGMSCPNSGFIGFPLVAQLLGPVVGGIALALAMVVELFITLPLALAVAESAGAGGGTRGERLRRALLQAWRATVRNPMIWGITLGFLFSLAGWRLPAAMAGAVDLFAMACGALSLFVIGGSLVGISPRGMARDVTVVALGKLVLHPLAVLGAVLLLPPMADELELAVILMAAVPMVGIYPILAQKFGHDTKAAAAQLVTTVASFFTLPALLYVVGRL